MFFVTKLAVSVIKKINLNNCNTLEFLQLMFVYEGF